LPEKAIRVFIAKLKDSEQKILDLIEHSYIPEDMSARAWELLFQTLLCQSVF
jgi:hypothetical protein